MYLLFIIILCLIALLVFFLKPQKPCNEIIQPFYHRNFAHRGLHTRDKSIPENSLAAFTNAVEHNYGIELDIQFSKDKQVVVFHDDTLDRVCDVSGKVCDYTYEELQQFSLCQTDQKIPLFSEVLALVNGKVPLIVELKSGANNDELCTEGYQLLSSYHGDYCIESFDPAIVKWFRIHAPQILRGQLSMPSRKLRKELNGFQSFLLGNLLSNYIARPNFIAYDKTAQPPFVNLAYTLGAMRVVWTVRDSDQIRGYEENNDAVIFEFYEPTINYD